MGLIFFLLIWVLFHLAVAFFGYRAQKFKELALTGIGCIPITLAVIVYFSIWIYGGCVWFNICLRRHDLGWHQRPIENPRRRPVHWGRGFTRPPSSLLRFG